jgi:two-component system nitrogen regulation response regulator GlnG
LSQEAVRKENLNYFEQGIDKEAIHPCFKKWDGNSVEIERVMNRTLLRASDKDPVLIVGESGTGKEYVAKAILKIKEYALKEDSHQEQPEVPYVAINCSTLNEELVIAELFGYVKGAFTGSSSTGRTGYFTKAKGGILFLDEFHHLNLYIQAKLLRAKQENEIFQVGSDKPTKIDVKLLLATTLDPDQIINPNPDGNSVILPDLIHRLNPYSMIHIPPLRERGFDILWFVKVALKENVFLKKMTNMRSHFWLLIIIKMVMFVC